MNRISNLVDLLQRQVQQRPLQNTYTFLIDGEAEEVDLTYEQVDRRARAIAARLQSLNATGERVLLLYPPGLDYITAFWGCLYAGAIAVPAYPPRQNRSLLRLQAVAADAQSTLALTTSSLLSKVDALTSQYAELMKLRWLATETIPDEMAQQWQSPSLGSDDLAFLQYTSGSTSIPKGVMVTHGNLLSNERMIQEAFHQTEQSVIVGWLPLYHDMGLVGNVLQPIYVGARCVLMSPVSFLQNPFRWLAAISRHRATTSGGPNFAYDLCVRKIGAKQRELLDLSSWEVAFNGAEPVHEASMTAFADAFAPCGFRMSAFRPCYGLAEATLLVSSETQTQASPLVKFVETEALQNNLAVEMTDAQKGHRSLVSCGRPPSGQQVYIYRPESLTACLPGEVGEICVSGPNLAKGYWNRPEETALTFQSHFPQGLPEPLLRTGDLGILLDGNLFVTGRLKDLIIIRGQNHYPQDIERTVEQSHSSLRLGSGAAFTVEADGEERLVVAQELNVRSQVNGDEIIQSIKEAIAEEHELQVHAVVLLKTGSIPKTSSGKIQRHVCRKKFLSKSFNPVAEWEMIAQSEIEGETLSAELETQSVESIEAWLRVEVGAKVGVPASAIEANLPISRYGLDSLGAIELTHEIEAKLGVILPMVSLLQSVSIAEIAAQAQLVASALRAKPVAVPTHASAVYPLSRGQQALWFLYQLAPESAAYNITTVVRIVSTLNVSVLQRAFQLLLDRHSSLRSTFSTHNDEPVQRILDHAEVSFQEHDASDLSEAALESRLAEEAGRRFDLERGPLLRVHLFACSKNDHVLLLVVHHIVADFWSLSVLTNELGILYTAEVAGTSAHLPSLPFEYGDYVQRQEEMLGGREGEKLWSYWQAQLAGGLPVLTVPADHARPPVQTYRGSSQAFKLSEEVTRGLKDLGRSHGATLYMILLAAFQTLLYRYTGQEDILIGSPTSGRNQNELAGLVGYFINPIVLRANFSSDATFTSFIEQTKQTVLSAFAHQDFPFPLLVERLQPDRDPSRSPLFQAMFILQKSHLLNEEGLAAFALGETGARVKLGALELESKALEQRISQFDLTLVMVEAGNALSASLQYNTDLFEPATIYQMTEHFKTLLESITIQPHQRLSELPLLTQAEKHQMLFEWNQTTTSYPQHLCLHHLFESQAGRRPRAIALIVDQQQLSYCELDRRANQLAQHLRTLGVGPEVFVGLLLNRHAEMVVALLAVLKAGAAYLPLEPTYPRERLRFMLQDTGATIVITEESLLSLADELLPFHNPDTGTEESATLQIVCLERDREIICRLPETVPPSAVLADNMAYVIYTSGSTGTPKGVVINHSSAVTMAQWAGEYFTEAQLAGVLASTSISFDLSVFELFAPLSVGGTIILAENPLQLPKLAASATVTLVNTVPSAIAELVRNGPLPASVETVSLAGEALSRELVEQLYGLETVKKVINLYGPSEDTTYSTYALIKRGEKGIPAIGRPLANTQVYVLDSAGQPVPVGVTGELYIGGAGLGRGYWRRPELTAERFVPDCLGGTRGGRLYRTGDLVRYREGGVLEYLGRADHQVKVRGYRIELAEVEAALRKHEQVRDAVAIVSEEGSEKRVVAYIVRKEEEATAADLRAWLRKRLPEYMVPQAFVMLEELPMTANGKVDRRALPAAKEAESGNGAEVIAPRTETEAAVAEMWREVLRLERVSVDDNFFEVGGHSLLATRVMSQVRKRLGVEVELRIFFEDATVEGLANQIDLAKKSAPVLNAQSIKPVPRTGNPPLSFAQKRLWFLNQLEPDNTAYNMPAALRLTGNLNIDALEKSLTEIVRRHEVMRTIFVIEDDEPKQIILPPQPIRISLIDLSCLSTHDREGEAMRLAKAEAQQPFELGVGPLVRLTLLRLEAEEHMLLLTVHHIVFDGWSTGVLISELTALYRAYESGHDSPLAELPVQYADYAVWQREWFQGEESEQLLSYWKRQLADATEALNLPSDKPRPAVRSTDGARQSFHVSPEVVLKLKMLGQKEGATLFMVLLAAFQVLLSRYTAQTDVMVGVAVSNRNRAEIEGLIGFFVNMLVMRGDLSGDPNFREYLGRVREVALESYAHQDVPFETLVESLPLGRSLNRTPLFQVAFVLENAPKGELELAGMKLSRVEVDADRAHFDLTLSLSETESGGLTAAINYSTDLFYAATIERMQEHFKTLLEGIVARPQQRLSELPLLTPDEQHQVLFDWNHCPALSAPPLCIHQLFEEQAALTPQAIAVISADAQVTYAELNQRANQLARYLRILGVGPEVSVGLCLERSVEMVVALLGILKAGGAYVPLNSHYPLERRTFMLADANISVLITEQALLDAFPAYEGRVVCVDRETEIIGEQAEENPVNLTSSGNLAYINYTSGSTGQPKGVSLVHRGVVRLVKQTKYASFDPEEVFLQLAPITFDASTFEIWGSLLNGARLVIMPPHPPSLQEVGEAIEQYEVTTLWLTSGLFNLMVDERLEDLKSLHQLLAGGDVLSVAHVKKFLAEAGDCRLINGYGPTENTTFTCCSTMQGGSVNGSVPIGYPIAHTEVYIFDDHQRPVPIGVSGELYIGGEGLARGYLNAHELTAEKFVPHPYSKQGGERLYRTGDLVRHRPDGSIEFLGRRDRQVKVRGFRIELGEIEIILGQHPNVREVVTMVHEDAAVDYKRLAAYVVAAEGQGSLAPAKLRQYLMARLPDYMVPQDFVVLGELPLTANGKVDRDALLSIALRERGDSELTEPRTETERAVAEMWSDVLGVAGPVSVDDNFFFVGGHSLLATRMILQVRKRFGVDVKLRSFFQQATVEGLASFIELALQARAKSIVPSIIKASREQYRMNASPQDTLVLPEALRTGALPKSTLKLNGKASDSSPASDEKESFGLDSETSGNP
jgi:amino acid adenylation domain-containing protein